MLRWHRYRSDPHRKALLRSNDLCEASVGAAVLNALLPRGEHKKLNVFEHILKIAEDYRKMGVVGRFPFIPELRKRNDMVLVFETEPRGKELPDALEMSSCLIATLS